MANVLTAKKKLMGFGISLIFLISLSSCLRINEVELNPAGNDAGNEFIELYSSSQENLTGWKIRNNDLQEKTLNFSFSGYYVLELSSQFLDNSDERVFLIDLNNNITDSTPIFADSLNDNKTWQYCASGWKFEEKTNNFENNCSENSIQENKTENPSVEETNITIEINLEYEKEFRNGNEISVNVKASNRSYEMKIYIEDKDGKIISEIYDENKEKWVFGNYYVNFSDYADIRIKSKYRDFYGKTQINARLRDNNRIVGEYTGNIKILEYVNKTFVEENFTENKTIENITRIIELKGKDIKTPNNILKLQGKGYLLAFAFFCIIAIIILLLKYGKNKSYTDT